MQGIVAERNSRRRAATAGLAASAVRCARGLACAAAALLLSGCYVMQAASGQIDILAKSQPIPRVLADPRTTASTRAGLELAQQARAFAVNELALPDSDSYRRYADLGRSYAVWNVVATPEFSLQPRRWCFPIAGCVTYRGYFHEASAQAYAWQGIADGDDAVVEGVATYSTLGHLPDPLFNTMLGWRESRLVGTIIHELAHERLYVAGDSEFNEAFASVVEAAGVQRWLAAHGRPQETEAQRLALAREADFLALLRGARERLQALYAGPLDEAGKRIEKNRIFGQLKFEYAEQRARWGGYAGYDAWFARPLNNARLASVATYQQCVPGLERELASAGTLPAFYARAEALARQTRAERHAAVCTGR